MLWTLHLRETILYTIQGIKNRHAFGQCTIDNGLTRKCIRIVDLGFQEIEGR
jgi:hypothetical protein